MEEKRDKRQVNIQKRNRKPCSPPASGNAQGRGPTIYPTPDVKTDASIISARDKMKMRRVE